MFPGEIPGRSRLELLGRRRGAGCAFMEWLTAVCNQSQPFLQRNGFDMKPYGLGMLHLPAKGFYFSAAGLLSYAVNVLDLPWVFVAVCV